MANEEFKAGDRVKVYGVETVILRRMPEAEDYEVELTDEQQAQGLTPFVLPGRMELVKRGSAKAAETEVAPEADGTTEPATETAAERARDATGRFASSDA